MLVCSCCSFRYMVFHFITLEDHLYVKRSNENLLNFITFFLGGHCYNSKVDGMRWFFYIGLFVCFCLSLSVMVVCLQDNSRVLKVTRRSFFDQNLLSSFIIKTLLYLNAQNLWASCRANLLSNKSISLATCLCWVKLYPQVSILLIQEDDSFVYIRFKALF